MENNNKIEYPSKTTYWIASEDGAFRTYGSMESTQVLASLYDIKTYSTKSKWKSALKKKGVDAEELKEL